jgi:hypothetical protein
MKVFSAAAGAASLDYARELSARTALKQAREARKSEVSTDAARALSSPRFEASETRKSQARAKLQQVRDWVKIVRKLYAQNPKAMAKALAQAFKDLKSAVQSFKDAGGQEMGATGEAVGSQLASAPAGKSDKAAERSVDGADDDSAADRASSGDATRAAREGEAGEGDAGPEGRTESASTVFEGRSLYDAVVSEVRKQIGEDGLQFLKEVREMVGEIGKLLEAARGQAAIRRRDKETEKAFEETDKALKELHEVMDRMEGEIRRDAPAAGMALSVAA